MLVPGEFALLLNVQSLSSSAKFSSQIHRLQEGTAFYQIRQRREAAFEVKIPQAFGFEGADGGGLQCSESQLTNEMMHLNRVGARG